MNSVAGLNQRAGVFLPETGEVKPRGRLTSLAPDLKPPLHTSSAKGSVRVPFTGIPPTPLMQFFKGILQETGDEVVADERRSGQRMAVGADFPLKSMLSFIGRDENGELLGGKRANWNWKGRLVNCSEIGANMRLAPSVRAKKGDACDLKLSLEEINLVIPSRIVNLRETDDGVHCGLKHEIEDLGVEKGYAQFLEIVALGAALQPSFKKTQPDDSGFLPEQYASSWQSCLNVWRRQADGKINAFEFVLRDCLVRAVKEHEMECFTGTSPANAKPATTYRTWEIKRLYSWVVPNLPRKVPADVQKFLRGYLEP